MSRLVLVDGTFELFRAFYGAPSKATETGFEFSAALSVCRNLLSLSRQKDVDYLAVAFDTEIESFRNELFDGYKTGEGIDPDLFAQFPLVEDLCEAMGLSVQRMIRYEADDGLATLARRFSKHPALERIIIASPDKDLTQCVVGDRIVTWDRIRDRVFDESGVIERMGVRPQQVPDYLALVGDAADGIPGLPRWGAKSSAKILSVYARLEDIPSDPETWTVSVRGKAALSESLEGMRQEVLLFRTLATLVEDVPIQVELEDLAPAAPSKQALQAVVEKYQAPELLPALSRHFWASQS